MQRLKTYLWISCLLSIGLAACTPKVESIHFGKEACTQCKMIISDPRFGAELVTEKGKVYKFDAAECMIAYLEKPTQKSQKYAFVQAIAYDTPQDLHSVHDLSFYISPDLPSPMGANLSSFRDRTFTQKIQKEGVFYAWEELRLKLQVESNLPMHP